MALVELPRRAAPNLIESGRWPRRSTSGLAARGAVLRPLDADEVRGEIALLARGGGRGDRRLLPALSPSSRLTSVTVGLLRP